MMNFTESKKLGLIDGLVHGFSNRNVGTNSSEIEKQFNLPNIAQLKQVHSDEVIIVEDIDQHNNLIEADALITNLKGVGVAVRTADCVPVLIADKNKSVIAAVHAGWRGTCSQIVVNTVKMMGSKYGATPANLTAAIGPSIKSCCYEVGDDVATLFTDKFEDTQEYMSKTAESKYLLDISIANRLQLREAGVADIEILDICTKCDDSFYSYRREGKGVSTQLSFIALK